MNSAASVLKEDALRRPAIVFSPHQDDESLGCGGTIIKKKRAGADIKIVFMTDGSSSHSHLISPDKLKSIRVEEALAASKVLGLRKDDVTFLDFKDGELNQVQNGAVTKVREILHSFRPLEIFIPYYKEPPQDHFVTNRIVLSALRQCKQETIIYEYPIWFWNHWPWTSPLSRIQSDSWRNLIVDSVKAGLGLRVLKDFRWSVYVGDVVEYKRAALNEHKSQMTQLIPNVGWLTLGDVSNGEFLNYFFQDHEFFRRYKFWGS